jgi:hypothetical protein
VHSIVDAFAEAVRQITKIIDECRDSYDSSSDNDEDIVTLGNTLPSAHFTDPSFTQDFQHQPDYSLGQYNNTNAFQTQQPSVPSQNDDVSNNVRQVGFQNIGNMSRPRGTSEPPNPSSAAYPQGNGNEWMNMGAYRTQQRLPSNQLSDISSAHNSPYMPTRDSFEHSSPMLNPSADPSFSDSIEFSRFNLNDGHHAQNFYSPGHSPHISPRLMPQQNELPPFTADNNFEMVPAMSGQFIQPNANEGPEMFPSYGQDSFPSYGNQPTSPSDLGAADQMSPPGISIDYAPPARQNTVRPRPSRSTGDGENLSPPMRREIHLLACGLCMY